jgi:ethanolamine utilization protein EutQ
MTVQHLTTESVGTWYQQGSVQMVVGDAVDAGGDAPMVIGFARYRKGATNEVHLPYDEALIITRGVFTVHRADGVATAKAGEIIFHRADAKVVYEANEDAEMVYVCHPAIALKPAGGEEFHPASDGLADQLAPDAPASRARLAAG